GAQCHPVATKSCVLGIGCLKRNSYGARTRLVVVLLVTSLSFGGLATFVAVASGDSASGPSSLKGNTQCILEPASPASAGVASVAGHARITAGIPLSGPGTGIGSILSTIDLVSNRTLPGNAGVAQEIIPQYGVYDSVNGQIYIRNSEDSETPLGAISTATNRMVADIATPGGEDTDF